MISWLVQKFDLRKPSASAYFLLGRDKKCWRNDIIKFVEGICSGILCNIKTEIYENWISRSFWLIGKSLPLTCFLSIDTKVCEKGATSKVFLILKQNNIDTRQTKSIDKRKTRRAQLKFHFIYAKYTTINSANQTFHNFLLSSTRLVWCHFVVSTGSLF